MTYLLTLWLLAAGQVFGADVECLGTRIAVGLRRRLLRTTGRSW